jgi:AraC-like DNA-binding protein
MIVLSTDVVPPRDRAAFWTEMVSRSIMNCDVVQTGDGPLHSELRGAMIGGLALADVEGSNMRARHTRAHIARAPAQFYYVGTQIAGTNCHRWGGQDILETLGDIFITDTQHTYEVDCERPFRQFLVRLPKAWIDARVSRPDCVGGMRLPRDLPMVRLFSSYAREGFENAARMSADAAQMFESHCVELLALALDERLAGSPLPAQALREALFVRAGRLIALRFAEPDLTPDRIARALGVSTRLLQRIFAERDATVMARVWEERVRQAAALLGEPEAAHRSITEIAYACGFNDSAHFTRAFAARMALTPSQWRQHAGEHGYRRRSGHA